jgi:acetylglutamate/LysW-gamma-L-alpha-aminoadipate kinase
MIVLKIGGDVFKERLDSGLSTDIKNILAVEKLVMIHGGGDEVTEIAEKLGKKQTFIFSPGRIKSRYTDRETVEIYTMVMAGKINKEIVKFLLGEEIPAVGLAGIDAFLLRAKRKKRLIIIDERNRKRIIDGGFTGKIYQVNNELLKLLTDNGFVPVISPIAIGEEHELLNVDSDRAAANIAGSLKADKIVFLTDVPGVLMKGEKIGKLSVREAELLLPKIGAGMKKKIIASVEAVKAGVNEAIIASGFVNEPVTKAINRHMGTVISFE